MVATLLCTTTNRVNIRQTRLPGAEPVLPGNNRFSPLKRFILPGLLGLLFGSCVYAIDSPDINSGIPDTDASESEIEPARLRQTVLQYVTQILELQQQHGAYHESLSEELIGLGEAYKQLGRYEGAVDAFTRSLHINRVNHGPDNPDQLPILDLIIEANTAAGNREELDRNYDYLYWAGRRIYGEEDPRILDLISRITRWRINAYLTRIDEIPFKHLSKSHSLCHDAIMIIENMYGPNDMHLINALKCIQSTNVYLNRYIWSLADWKERVNVIRKLGQHIKYSEIKEAAYRMGNIYAVNERLPVEYRVEALSQVADWCFFNKRKTKGIEFYNLANQIMAENNTDASHDENLFNKPAFLGSIRLPPLSGDEYDNNRFDEEYVKILFDVTINGRTYNLKIIEETSLVDYRIKRRARNYVRFARFRPRIVDGEPAVTRELEMLLPLTLLVNGADGKVQIRTPASRTPQS